MCKQRCYGAQNRYEHLLPPSYLFENILFAETLTLGEIRVSCLATVMECSRYVRIYVIPVEMCHRMLIGSI